MGLDVRKVLAGPHVARETKRRPNDRRSLMIANQLMAKIIHTKVEETIAPVPAKEVPTMTTSSDSEIPTPAEGDSAPHISH